MKVLIIGCGPAGITAAIFASRLGLEPVLVCKEPCGQLPVIARIENYPALPGIAGTELCSRLLEHLNFCGIEPLHDEVVSLERTEQFAARTANGAVLEAPAVILATGSRRKRLDIPGAQLPGVHYCALCDGALYAGKKVAVIGCGAGAAHDAQVLLNLGAEVYIICRSRPRARMPPGARIVYGRPTRVLGSRRVEAVEIEHAGKKQVLEVAAVFVAIGQEPCSELARQVGAQLDEQGRVVVDWRMRTTVPGLFAAGDVCSLGAKQIIVAAAQGAQAAISAAEFLGAPGGI
ncbi:MAG: FAD-dependent oxidoreductase [bacterium]|nr:FAD-dependent oxidoreductase [bacterium]